ncbi:MAG: hypothetical protein Q8R44_12305 [Novosphingobium sp.]|nr:hypothetical protein [Novosphingobium sp.]
MFIPAQNSFGVRETINANLTPAQKVWNLRSAMNVAALNCLEPQYAAILENYKVFLKAQTKGLSATNRALDAEFRAKYGATYRDVRDSYMTQVYNYFALPPTLPRFCGASLAVSNELAAVAPTGLDTFAAGALPRLEAVFDDFFGAFEQYRIDVAQWDAQYGPKYGTTSAGYSNPLAPTATVSTAPPVVRPAITLTDPGPSMVSPAPVTRPAPAIAAPAPGTLVLPPVTPAPVASPAPAIVAPAPGTLVLPPVTPTPTAPAKPTYGPSGGRKR